MSKASGGRFFEDFAIGQALSCSPPRQVDAALALSYGALTGDRTPALPPHGSIVHPLIVFHTVFSQTVRAVSLNAKANLGYAELVMHRSVPSGALLATETEVIGLRETSSAKTGIVWVRTTGRDAQGAVISFVRWVLVKKRSQDPTRWRGSGAVVPTTAEAVDEADLPAAEPSSHPAIRFGLEDYSVGEVIDHPDGHTVTEAEHMGFTRLFGNSARVHFDAELTGGKPLVFGGYTISIGYAQALEGLDGRQGLIAINGGAHRAPVYAGDTLRSQSEVLAVAPDAQAVRLALRMRNQRDDLVLDLDYWERMPRSSTKITS